MDHETALAAANQALSGGAPRGTSRIESFDLLGVGENRDRSSRRAAPAPSQLPSGTWELAAMLSVGLVTLLFVLALWFM